MIMKKIYSARFVIPEIIMRQVPDLRLSNILNVLVTAFTASKQLSYLFQLRVNKMLAKM